jgi:hypothetical protein
MKIGAPKRLRFYFTIAPSTLDKTSFVLQHVLRSVSKKTSPFAVSILATPLMVALGYCFLISIRGV